MRRAKLLLAALPLTVLQVAAASDMSGKWTIVGDVQGNAVNLNCLVQQDAEAKLAGTCQVNGMEPVTIAGALKDATFRFAFTAAGYELTYVGTVNGDTMEGEIQVAGVSGMFKGERAKG